MIDHGIMTETSTTPDGESASLPPSLEKPEDLEQRVHRLEDAVAALQDTRGVEDRVVERVSRRLNRKATQAAADATGGLANATRQLLPAAVDAIRNQADHAEAHAQASASAAPPHPPWILTEAYADARAMVRMYFDPRYRASWMARAIPLILLAAIVTSWIWLPGTMIIYSPLMTIIDKIVDLVLAFLAFKILSREVHRYRQTIADKPVATSMD
jgi:hypothetical protein